MFLLAAVAPAQGAPTASKLPPLAPVLPDLEWLASSTLAIDLLDRAEFAGETREADVRRAYVGASALWRRTWAASLGADLAHEGALGQASIAYFGLPVHVELGRFPEPFGLIQQEASIGQMLMDLPACLALAPGYGLGIAASFSEARRSLAIAVFAPTSVGDRIQRRRPEEALTIRLTGIPYQATATVLHLGAAFSLRRPRDDVIDFHAVPETVLLRDFHTSSAPLEADRYSVLGAELGLLAGPLLLQAESIVARIPVVDGPTTTFDGGYVQAGWTIGAERRGYRASRGVFGPVYSRHPIGQGGAGAVELAARYGHVDLTSNRLGDLAAVEGGPEFLEPYSGERVRIAALGINWYATDDVKFSFNRLDIDSDSRSSTQTAKVLQGRVQIQFTRP